MVGLRILLVCALLASACGESSTESPNGTGGTAGTGGMAGSGGGGTGGAAGQGGTPGGTVIDLDVTPYITGLNVPWDIGWLPNGTVVVTERPGRINVYADGVDEPPFVIEPTDLIANGEGGMLGLEIDPDFETNPYVYVCMCRTVNDQQDVIVRRYRLATPNGDGVVGEPDDIVTGMPYSTGRHSGCRPRFGPDGYLWVGTGDAAIGTTPQDDASLGGKVLRIDRDGNAAPGNDNGVIFSKGHRNIQGMAFRASDDLGVSAEHGPSVDDEVNLLVPGNFGWDPVPGYNESVPMTFDGAIEAIWSSGSSTLALSGATFIEGGQWADWDGVLAVATLRTEHLHIYVVTTAGEVTQDFRVVENQGRLRSPRQGPDGWLYITTDGSGSGGEVRRVTPVIAP